MTDPSPARVAMWRAMTEAQLLAAVVRTAERFGWLVHHDLPVTTFRKGQTRTRTAVMGSVGFPDLVLARRGEVLFVELKAESGRWGPGQADWLAALGPEAFMVKPRHMDRLLARLRTPPRLVPVVAEGTS